MWKHRVTRGIWTTSCLMHTAKTAFAGAARWMGVLISCSFPILQLTPHVQWMHGCGSHRQKLKEDTDAPTSKYMTYQEVCKSRKRRFAPSAYCAKGKTNHFKREVKVQRIPQHGCTLKDIMLREASQTQTSSGWFHLSELSRAFKLPETESRMVACQGVHRGKNGELSWSWSMAFSFVR